MNYTIHFYLMLASFFNCAILLVQGCCLLGMHRTLGRPSGRVRLPRPSRDLRRLLQGNLSLFLAMGLHKNRYNLVFD